MRREVTLWANREAGKADSKMPGIIAILILTVLGFLGYKFVPVHLHHMEYEKEITEIINWDRFFEGATKPTAEGSHLKIMERSKEMRIPLKEENLKVTETEDGRLRVDLHYTVDINIPIYGIYKKQYSMIKLQDL